MSNRHDPLFFAQISRFQRIYAKGLSNRLDTHDVTPGYLEILFRLWDQDNISQKQLHRLMDIEQATLSNTLTRMDRDGLITKVRNPKDRRVTNIELTPHGQSLKSVVETAISDLQSVVNTGLTINDRRYFSRILKQMTEQVENDLSDSILVLVDEVSE